jgi:hypothetical protein
VLLNFRLNLVFGIIAWSFFLRLKIKLGAGLICISRGCCDASEKAQDEIFFQVIG